MIDIWFDLDDTLCWYSRHHRSLVPFWGQYPQAEEDFYDELPPVEEAVDAYKTLESLGFKVGIATAPSIHNHYTYAGKARWVERNLGLEALKNMVIIDNKSLLKGKYLLDNSIEGKGQDEFEGILVHTPIGCNWPQIVEALINAKA